MTQRDLAAAVGVTESSIAQYESGRMSPRWGKADALDHTLGANGAILAAYGHTRAHAGHTPPAPENGG